MIWFYVSIACGVAQIVCAVVMYRAYQYTSNRARLAEGKYEALQKLNGDVPRKRLPMLDEELMEATYLENKTLKDALAKVQQSEREWHETALQNEAGLRKTQSELEAHKATPTRSEPCPWCKKTFDSKAQLRSHIQFHHDSEYTERNP